MKRLLFKFLFILPLLIWAQSSNHNYIKTTEYLDPNNLNDIKVTIQYYDGLGRPSQVNATKQSPNGKDIITLIEYDDFGRQAKEYLPAPTTIATGQYYENPGPFYDAYYNSVIYYAEKELEASPLNRVLKQAAPGDDWALGSGHEIEFDYQTNLNGEVKIFTASTSYNSTNKIYNISLNRHGGASYPAGQLYKTITKDENHESGNNNTIEEFKNKEGQVILKRTYALVNNIETPHDTYYVYDIYGNLTYVLPPLVNHNAAISINVLDNLCYQYKYDDRNRLVEKKLPGKGWEYMVYDKQDRLVATQDENMRSTTPAINPFGESMKVWLFTKYDKFGRVVYTGYYKYNGSRTNVRNLAYARNENNERRGSNFTHGGISIDYSKNGAFPYNNSNSTILTVNYYDDYDFSNAISPSSEVIGQDVINTSSVAARNYVTSKSLPTATFVKVLDNLNSNLWEKTFTYYDTKSRPIRTHKINHLGGHTIVDSKLDFRGKSLSSTTKHKKNTYENEIISTQSFKYDHAERLTKTIQSVQSTAMYISNPQELIALNQYDALGQLINKKVGGRDLSGANALQSIDYQYNIRGWLTNINNTDAIGDDLFAFAINYTEHTNTNYPNEVKGLYNGNIAETLWKTSTDNQLRGYGYAYDALNRLKRGYFKRGSSTNSYKRSFDEALTYDKSGNITSLSRWGNPDHITAPVAANIDDLNYVYYPNTNKLRKVDDQTGSTQGFKDGVNTTNEYFYDYNGNMTKDLNKGITQITYNHLNLPTQITFTGNNKKINYLYNASGVKVEKKVTNGTNIKTTHYLDGFQYVNGDLSFFPHAEGYVRINGNPAKTKYWYDYVYNYTDHLGNIRLSYTKDRLTGELKVLEENHYYPFGLEHHNYNQAKYDISLVKDIDDTFVIAKNAVDYKYKYNGKELQGELGLNWTAMDYRNYDNAIGRFMSVDPKAALLPSYSPYAYALNNPIIMIDPDGQYPIYFITRSYAPFKTFGPGYNWYGDDRGHTLDKGASYRTLASINYDTETYQTSAFGGRSRSHTVDGRKDAYSDTYIDNRSSGSNIDVHSYGNNAAQKGSWDIDQFTKLSVTTEGDIKGDHILSVTGTISGDDFPNQESMIYDAKGNTLWLGNFETSGDREYGPVTDLPLENEGNVNININARIKVNSDGIFQGVMQTGKDGKETMISIEDWNKKFE